MMRIIFATLLFLFSPILFAVTHSYGPVTVVCEKQCTLVTKHTRIDVNDPELLWKINGHSKKIFSAYSKQYPTLKLWSGDHAFPQTKSLPGGGQQLIFTYPLLNNCPACEKVGIATVGFRFDRDGNYLGEKVLSISAVK